MFCLRICIESRRYYAERHVKEPTLKLGMILQRESINKKLGTHIQKT